MVAVIAVERNTSQEELRELSWTFESESPPVWLRWALEEVGDEVSLATGFGAEGCVLVHMLSQIDRRARIFYLDTDLLFPETYALRDQLQSRYGGQFERRATSVPGRERAERFGEGLGNGHRGVGCGLRKAEPLVETLTDLQAWI